MLHSDLYKLHTITNFVTKLMFLIIRNDLVLC